MKNAFNPPPQPGGAVALGELIRLWQSQSCVSGPGADPLPELLQTNHALLEVLNLGPHLCWVLDVRTGGYCFMSSHAEQLLGESPRHFTEGGLAYTNGLLHPDDAGCAWQLMQAIWQFLLARPAGQRAAYGFSCDYRIRRADGTYLRLLEQSRVLQTDHHGNITHLLGTGTDITHWKESATLVASVASAADGSRLVCTSDNPVLKPQARISKREQEVMQLIANGFSSRQIADRLYLSLHTVNTHRRNIIGKTHYRSPGGLVRVAVRNGMI
jgi:DNA-binding CsgD family transcriptional regulator